MSTSNLNFIGSAATYRNNISNITLTSYTQQNTTGAVWLTQPIDVNAGFKVNFILEFYNPACLKQPSNSYSCSASDPTCVLNIIKKAFNEI